MTPPSAPRSGVTRRLAGHGGLPLADLEGPAAGLASYGDVERAPHRREGLLLTRLLGGSTLGGRA